MATAAEPALIPWPKSVQLDGGRLELTGRIVATDSKLTPLANVLAGEIDRMTGVKLAVANGAAKSGDIVLKLEAADEDAGPEFYRLEASDRATISGHTYRAVTWGTSTLLQLLDAQNGKLAVST